MHILYTTIINISGKRKLYSFLPPKGLYMEPDESITYKGDITNRFIPSYPYHRDPERPPNPRKIQALWDAVKRKELNVIYCTGIYRHEELTKLYRDIRYLGIVDPFYANKIKLKKMS